MPLDLRVRPALDDDEAGQVSALTSRLEAADGVSPLNDDARLALRHERSTVVHVLAFAGPELRGYAQFDHAGDRPTAVLGVDPAHRREGVGSALVDAVVRAASASAPARTAPAPTATASAPTEPAPTEPADTAPVGFWAFHDLPGARALAARQGLNPVRTLLMMRVELTEDVPAPATAPGIAVRAFVPGHDEQAWLAVNARAFADHPEQGRLTLPDLNDRMAEGWFDPADFLLAVDGTGTVVGFHWTKRHSPTRGEVYVLGVDPAYGGRGLGTALLLSGLRHLASIGITEVILYVEAEHERAVRLYAGHGFDTVTRDVMYARTSEPPVPPGEPEES